MPPELTGAVIAFAGGILVCVTAMVAFLPKIVQRQMNIRQTEQENRVKNQQDEQELRIKFQQKKLDESLEAARQEREAQNEERAMFKSLVTNIIQTSTANQMQQEILVKAYTRQTELFDLFGKELKSNTNITKEGVVAIGEMSDHVAELLEEGSQPVKQLTAKVDMYRQEVVAYNTKQERTAEMVTEIHQTIVGIQALQITLDAMLKLAELKLQEAKTATGEVASVPST